MIPTELALPERGDVPLAYASAVDKLLQPAQRAGLDLPALGTSNEPKGPMYWQAPTENWWLFSDHRSDPTAEAYGGVVVPREQRKKLVRLLAEGFDPDIVLVGHELPIGVTPSDPVPDLVPVSVPGSRAIAPPSLSPGTKRTLAALLEGAVTAGSLLASTSAALGRAAVQLDPVVLAGVRHDGCVVWVEVCRWSW